jgi:hypothetical protein
MYIIKSRLDMQHVHLFWPCLDSKNFQDFLSHRMFGHMYGVLNVDGKKLITQFGRKLRDESFEPN